MSGAIGPIRRSLGRDDWGTPRDLVSALHDEFHFTLDAAADETNHLFPCYFSPEQNALAQDWQHHVAFCNPPFGDSYGTNMTQWITKFADSAKDGATVVAPLPVGVTAAWAHLMWETASEIRRIPWRVQYIHPVGCGCEACKQGKKGSNASDSIVVVWRRFWHRSVGSPRVSLFTYQRDKVQRARRVKP